MIEKSSIEQLKNLIDIVDVIGDYIELKKAGTNYKALCPFHNEDTPSFVVSPSKQIFHCFGCQKGGDAIKFVMEYEKLSYPEAIEKLASMYNFTLSYGSKKESVSSLFKALESINALYKKELAHTPKALEYLKKRGVLNSSIERFELGYAPNGPKQIDYLKSRFIPLQEAIDAGILAQQEGRIYARLTDRVTFPIYSPNGALIAFGGRTLGNHPAKYLNSPETKIFHKSKVLYGYHLAKQDIYAKKRLILCEGYMDVVMLHQAGFTTAVATLGTALTPLHLPLLRRGEPKVIVAYDGDKAGMSAALKAAKLLSVSDIEGGVVLFGGGEDPADMVQKGAIEEFEKLFNTPRPFIEFVLETTIKQYDLSNPKEKEKALLAAVEYLRTLSPLLQEEYKHYLAALLEILPSKIPLRPQKKEYQKSPSLETKDIEEQSILKTILLNPDLLNSVLDIVTPEHFIYHKEEFKLLLEDKLEHPKLREILLDEDIHPIAPDMLTQALLRLLIQYYEQKIQKILKEDIPFTQKSFFIRKYKDNIIKLKRGEPVIE